MRHLARARHSYDEPVHVTLRRAKGLPSLRSERLHRLVKEAIRDTCRKLAEDGFRVVHYSVQADHVHLIVEAEDDATLTRGMQSFAVRVAMRVNRDIFARRRGRIWADRYHRRDLASPTEVRNALVYVLANHLKHGEAAVGLLDPCSSGPWFDGWHHAPSRPPDPSPVARPGTWLLRTGWQLTGIGFIHLGERPRAARAARRARAHR